MKFFTFLLSSSVVAIGSATAKPFALAPSARLTAKQTLPLPTRDDQVSPTVSVFDVPRGGDLGPLTADAAAKALVGFTALNGYLSWQAVDGMLKAWDIGDEATAKQKLLISASGCNMFAVAIVGIALLRGSSVGTSIGLLCLISIGLTSSWIIDDVSTKHDFPKEGLYINLATHVAAAYANLLNKDWAAVANKVLAVFTGLNAAVAVVAPGKFNEVWKLDEEGGGALSTLISNNLIWTIAGQTTLICSLVFLDAPEATKVIGYSHIPLALLCLYNVFLSKAAKEVTEKDLPKFLFAAIATVLVSATLL